MPDSFLDSNVLVYFASRDVAKARRAEALIDAGGTISVQVLNEVANVCRRKLAFDWDEVAGTLVRLRLKLNVVPLTVAVHQHGITLAARYRLSVYDGQTVAAALQAGCECLWSEDLHDGLVVESQLTIRNPFRSSSSH